MAWEHREGQFIIFPNQYKEEGDNKPDFRGDGLFSGEMVELALWWKDGRKGRFLSGQIKRKTEVADQAQSRFSRHEDEPEQPRRSLKDEIDDEIPF